MGYSVFLNQVFIELFRGLVQAHSKSFSIFKQENPADSTFNAIRESVLHPAAEFDRSLLRVFSLAISSVTALSSYDQLMKADPSPSVNQKCIFTKTTIINIHN